jgi:type VI secretion system protein ImpC
MPTATMPRPGTLSAEQTEKLGPLVLEEAIKRFGEDLKNTRKITAEELADLTHAVAGGHPLDPSASAFIDGCISEIESRMSHRMDAILHLPDVQELMGRWIGLERMVGNPSVSDDVGIWVKPATKAAWLEDYRNHGRNIKRTKGTEQFVRNRYGVAGGKPFLCAIADFELGVGADDMELAEMFARMGELGHMPVLSNAAASFFGDKIAGFADMPRDPKTIKDLFDARSHAKYRAFRGSKESRYLTLCMPNTHVRVPFGPDKQAPGCDWYTETVKSEVQLTKAGAALAMGTCIAVSMSEFEWPAAIRGRRYGGRIGGLALHTFSPGTGDERSNCPTEVAIDDELELPLDALGFLSLVHHQGEDFAVFYSDTSAQKPQSSANPSEAAAAELSAKLPNLLICSRFAHFAKQIMRDLIGSGKTAPDIKEYLQTWACDYVLESPEGAGEEVLAARPFRKIEFTVVERPGKPGYLDIQIDMIPHYKVSGFMAQMLIVDKEFDD